MKRGVKINEILLFSNISSSEKDFIWDSPKYADLWDVLSWEGNRTK